MQMTGFVSVRTRGLLCVWAHDSFSFGSRFRPFRKGWMTTVVCPPRCVGLSCVSIRLGILMSKGKEKGKHGIRWMLIPYDMFVLAVSSILVLALASGGKTMGTKLIIQHTLLFAAVSFIFRFVFQIYSLVWRYGGIQSYMRLMISDFLSFGVYFLLARLLDLSGMLQVRMLAFVLTYLVLSMGMRMTYRYAFKYGNNETFIGRVLVLLLRVFGRIDPKHFDVNRKIRVAILGAGRVGVALAGEFLGNKDSLYEPVCFIDISKNKVGREILGIKVYVEDETIQSRLTDIGVQQIVFTVTGQNQAKKVELYDRYRSMGFKVMNYESPQLEDAESKPQLREFSVEELLFRKQQFVVDEKTIAYYKNKVILITGGGGSIGSELCRQIASMSPKQLIVLDVYENGAYDIQQELGIKYKGRLDLRVEICSITDKKALDSIFGQYRPQIVINAAAHKHVPLMEHNCIEAIENNVFGCKNVIDCCEEFGAERFMMVSTDKAVNPTNVMGATKRMCEMMVQSASITGKVKYSATRFGNVLGSAGSVIPLFKRQIEQGGPVTVTDKRITRYFMTIPEASQLVLASGAMAKNGDLFVLDMGQPVRIYELAQSMIRLMGASDVEIVETGLRPGEKLYEELLVKTEELDKTENKKIFIEHDKSLPKQDIDSKLSVLKKTCATGGNDKAREALRSVVPTFIRPEEFNK